MTGKKDKKKNIKSPSKLFWAGAAALIPALVFLVGQVKKGHPLKGTPFKENTYTVEYVVDGDTFVTKEKMSVRFDTLNAPELKDCGGPEAKKALETLLPPGKKVQLDIQARDPNGRQVASVWAGITWIDGEMIKTGWAVYASSTVDKEHKLQNMDFENRNKKIGVYSEKCTQYQNLVQPKCDIKGNIASEWTRRKEKVYFVPGCAHYKPARVDLWKGEQWFCNEEEAVKAGYRKAESCP